MFIASLLPSPPFHFLSWLPVIVFPSTIVIITISCFLFIVFNQLTPAPFSPLPCLPFHISSCKLSMEEEEEEEEDEEGEEQQEEQEEDEEGEEEHEEEGRMVCVFCKETYGCRIAGTCKECYQEAGETEEVLKKEIQELKARLSFLKTWAPEAISSTDIVLESCDGLTIMAHKAVLVSRSSVFKAMLENDMKESRRGVIKITDSSYALLRLFVHYLYTAELYPESLGECAFDLLALAEKYNVKHLKTVCERFLASKINIHNALFNFEYANLHGAKILKEGALCILLENIHQLTGRVEYRDLVTRDAKLVVEIYEAYVAKKFTGNNRRI